MLTARIIPCLDVRGGRVVKGTKFQDVTRCGDPVSQATAYAAAGADELVMLDVSATIEERMACARCGREPTRPLEHSADGGRWGSFHRRRSTIIGSRRRQSSRQLRGRGQTHAHPRTVVRI